MHGRARCNILAMERSHPKVLRLNLVGSPKDLEGASLVVSELEDSPEGHPRNKDSTLNTIRGVAVSL